MKKVAIIGAGVAGIAAAKSALEENLIPVVFERDEAIGGVWRVNNGYAWPSMEVNISRYTNVFSDFPWNDSEKAFPPVGVVNQYLHEYIEHFKLKDYFRLKCNVTCINKKNEKWEVTWKHDDKTYTELFDTLVWPKWRVPHRPVFSGMENFSNTIIHSSEFRTADKFKNKKVVVIGNGSSGIAISEEMANAGANVINVFRKPKWIISRSLPIGDSSLPRDLFNTRAYYPERSYEKMLSSCGEQNEIPNLRMYKNSVFGKTVQINYVELVKAKKILTMLSEIDSFDKNTLVLKNGQSIDNIDVVVLCTGYQLDLSCFSSELDINPQPLELYEETFPLMPNLAFLGFIANGRGSAFPLLELQARFVMAVLGGRLTLPNEEDMKNAMSKIGRAHV